MAKFQLHLTGVEISQLLKLTTYCTGGEEIQIGVCWERVVILSHLRLL